MSEPRDIDLLVVDDDDDFRSTLVRRFEHDGYSVQGASNGEEAWALLTRRDFHVAVVDNKMPGLSGLELLQRLHEHHIECQVILLTGEGTIESAVDAMKHGAFDYLTKPFPLKDIESRIGKAHEKYLLQKENRQLRTILARSQPNEEMVGQSPTMLNLFKLIERAGPSDKAILIQGESGTGKELVARALHRNSRRGDKPLVTINCAALPESLLESELFGHEKGAFTGATAAKPGLFEVADQGTLFIDEIGEMPGSLQAKLLRVLEDGLIRRVGSIRERRVDVRLLCATNRDLAHEVREGNFREDLYYRINVMSLELPPIRERKGDLPLLVAHFLGPNWEIEPEALRLIQSYHWPGNVRQLINAVERAKIIADGIVLRLRDLPPEVLEGAPPGGLAVSCGDELADIEKRKIIEVLERENGNKTRAARALGIDRRKLYRLVEKYEITDT